tara:strand:+ start:30957 stop:32048 length:1092 start_codon:yes stop_codon:yes gene_type:complete
MSYPCGASHFASMYAKNLADAGHEVTVLTSNTSSTENQESFKVKIIPGNWNLSHVLKVSKFLNSEGFDLFDIQFETYMYGAKGGVLLLPYLVKNKIHPILTMHSEALPKFGGRLWRMIQYTAFKKVIFYSKAFQQNALNRFPKRKEDFYQLGFPSNISKVHYSELQKFTQKIKAKEFSNSPVAIYFGHINNNRGIEDLLFVVKKLKETGKEFKLILMSQFTPDKNQYHRDLLSEIDSLGIKENIAFTDRVDDELVSLFFQSADFAILPFTDGASFKNGSLATAVIHSLPMITTLNEKTETELQNCSGIKFYPTGDRAKLEEVLMEFFKDRSLWTTYSKEIEKLGHIYSWNNYIEVRNKIYGVT